MTEFARDLGRSRPPKLREVVSRKGFLRRWARAAIGRTLGWMFGLRYRLILGGPVFFETVHAACELNLFALLKRKPGLTLAEIARELRIEENVAQILLMTCVVLKLVKKRGPGYRCARPLGRLLDPSDPWSVVPILEWMHHIVYPSMFYYAQAIRENRAAGLQAFAGDEDNLYERMAHDPHLEAVFDEAMGVRDRQTEREFLNRIDLSGFKRVLDVAGGGGVNLLGIAKRHPQVRGTLFDLPTVTQIAAKRFAENGVSDRLTTQGGNVLTDEFPRGHDCHLFCRLTPALSPAVNLSLIKKAFQALEPGGMLCIYGPFVEDPATGSFEAAVLSPYFFCTATGQGRMYSWDETKSWLADAGFVDIARVNLVRGDGVLLGFKP